MAGYALPAECEERQVLASCLAGEAGGLDLLYRRYAPALVQFCEHRLGGVGDAEDAAHETILKAHRAMPRFREGARLWPWLATIAANVCTDMQRSRERLGAEPDETDWLAPEVDEDVSRRLRASIVDAAIDELPERFRTPLFLREFMGWSYEDIATFSNKSIGSVRTTLMRARRAFQARVEDVARRRGQWPLPALVVGGWRRLRATLRSWRDAVSRAASDGAAVLWRADGLLSAATPGMHMAVAAMVAAGAFAVGPGALSGGDPMNLSPVAASAVGLRGTTHAAASFQASSSTVGGASTSGGAPAGSRTLFHVNPTDGPLKPAGKNENTYVGIQERPDGNSELVAKVVPVDTVDLGAGIRADFVKCYTTSKVETALCQVWRATPAGK